jgi:hypothetical protein
MDNRFHAQMMARHCPPRIAELVVRVPSEKQDDDNFQLRLIGSLVHGCQMANNCQYAEGKEMQYAITERLFAEATPNSIGVQHDGHMAIVGMVSHASGMAVSAHEAAAEILSTVQPTTVEPLPTTQRELDGLRARLNDARQEISNIAFRVLGERRLQNLGR